MSRETYYELKLPFMVNDLVLVKEDHQELAQKRRLSLQEVNWFRDGGTVVEIAINSSGVHYIVKSKLHPGVRQRFWGWELLIK